MNPRVQATATPRAARALLIVLAVTSVILLALFSFAVNRIGFFVLFSGRPPFPPAESDEAPIRVKNGSLDFTITDNTQQWEQPGGSDHWRIKDKDRKTDEFDVTIARYGGTCTGPLSTQERFLQFTYSDGAVIQVQSNKKFIMVKGINGATLSATGNVLSYGTRGDGYLAAIIAGKNVNQVTASCTFGDKKDLDSIVILNPPI
jgi:hypothetical protein